MKRRRPDPSEALRNAGRRKQNLEATAIYVHGPDRPPTIVVEDVGWSGDSALVTAARVGEVRELPADLRPELVSCVECGSPSWISASSRETVERRGLIMKPVCNRCLASAR